MNRMRRAVTGWSYSEAVYIRLTNSQTDCRTVEPATRPIGCKVEGLETGTKKSVTTIMGHIYTAHTLVDRLYTLASAARMMFGKGYDIQLQLEKSMSTGLSRIYTAHDLANRLSRDCSQAGAKVFKGYDVAQATKKSVLAVFDCIYTGHDLACRLLDTCMATLAMSGEDSAMT